MNDDISNFCFEMKKASDLPSMLETSLRDNYNKLDIVRNYQKKMLFQLDGKASQRVRDTILDRLENRS